MGWEAALPARQRRAKPAKISFLNGRNFLRAHEIKKRDSGEKVFGLPRGRVSFPQKRFMQSLKYPAKLNTPYAWRI
ncbi:hypothetical protein COT82_00675 [Candidatus Campbellbacteria bacterium CG10_big_fil_rev_8_21_14_0_10_35_52]|uniref:Uncharacterized protein n=1 Tax=Candidatus Campbellbacteria bacterium CG10_big_fil_rev_8_21_14_0_10_35_52 TaxID=1974527 RepID=A0A2M6WVR6_9BACT|nr:MAG: hypothetical protein COT82_00675 [Candidatus Campbellbacteria bacterium CG10_big_fil_rev_8_21_14_0_10_35_52]